MLHQSKKPRRPGKWRTCNLKVIPQIIALIEADITRSNLEADGKLIREPGEERVFIEPARNGEPAYIEIDGPSMVIRVRATPDYEPRLNPRATLLTPYRYRPIKLEQVVKVVWRYRVVSKKAAA